MADTHALLEGVAQGGIIALSHGRMGRHGGDRPVAEIGGRDDMTKQITDSGILNHKVQKVVRS